MNEGRREIIQIVFVLVGVIFLIKLFLIQVIDSRYKQLADSNAILPEVDYPVRGLIKDRNGKLIVYNTPEFDLNIIHKEVKNFDSAKFCAVFSKTPQELRLLFKELKARREYSRVKPTVFLTKLSTLDFAKIQDNIACAILKIEPGRYCAIKGRLNNGLFVSLLISTKFEP